MDKKRLKQCELLAIEREIQVHRRIKHENIVIYHYLTYNPRFNYMILLKLMTK
jgi:serine/threonine protein kinase